MDELQSYIDDRSMRDPEFKAEYEAEAAMLALVRARQEANMTQKDVADALQVSQPYIAQIERGSRTPGYLFLFKYASVVGASIHIESASDKVAS
ncbi:MAG: helix-turn-helix transcriptional regulator [Armatimonadota bacterium]